MNCPQCGYENPPIAKFCGRCGTPQTPQQSFHQQPQSQFQNLQPKGKGIFGMFLVSPIGALIAIICFSFPWIEVHCDNKTLDTKTGFDIAFHDEKIFIIVLVLAVMIITGVLIFKFIKKPVIGMPIALAGAVISLVIMTIKYLDYMDKYGKEIFKVKFGAIGTTIGLFIAFIGGILLLFEKKD